MGKGIISWTALFQINTVHTKEIEGNKKAKRADPRKKQKNIETKTQNQTIRATGIRTDDDFWELSQSKKTASKPIRRREQKQNEFT